MKLYFGNTITTVTTISIIGLLAFVGYSLWNRADIQFWGRRSLFLCFYGLLICCFAAARDGLDREDYLNKPQTQQAVSYLQSRWGS